MPQREKPMNDTKKSLFATYGGLILGIGLLLLVAVALGGCSEPVAIAAVEPTPTTYAPPPTDIPSPPPGPTPASLDFPLPPPKHVEAQVPDDDACVTCHTQETFLQAMAGQNSRTQNNVWAAAMPSLETWQKALVDPEAFFETMHGRYGCISCHGGSPGTGGKEAAHEGMVPAPDAAEACGDCHPEQVATQGDSLHATMAGFEAALAARSTPDKMSQLDIMVDNHCSDCHATCGDCHVSRPADVGGGLLDGHLFEAQAAVDETCAACHGSTVAGEFETDVHQAQAGMSCTDCHPASEMHGTADGTDAAATTPGCQDSGCHDDVAPGEGNPQHTAFHFEAMSCQVCHSTAYQNCFGCHVSQRNGTASYDLEDSQTAFKIGRNPQPTKDQPWQYVPVRHVPVTPDSFDYYGQNLLPNFDAVPTWQSAMPHNIQRITPQNETCGSCHGNAEFFLTADDVAPEEMDANQDIIVEELPFAMP